MSHVRFHHCIALIAGAFVALCAATPVKADGCQSGSTANSPTAYLLNSANCQADASGSDATAVGRLASATWDASTAVGDNAKAKGIGGTALGYLTYAPEWGTALGFAAGQLGVPRGATMLGAFSGNGGAGAFSTAIGGADSTERAVHARGGYSIAIGGGDGSAPFGKPLVGANSNKLLSIAIGNASVANSDFAMAFGFNAKAGSGVGPIGPIAIGPDARATLTNATALGRFSAATAQNTIALGSGSTATQNSSVALGHGSVANVANTVSVGTSTSRRRIMNVAPGIANSDVPTLGQVKNIATAAAQAELAAAGVNDNTDIRRELAELRAMVKQQQQEIAALKSQKAAALSH